jgi:hypothetical protein
VCSSCPACLQAPGGSAVYGDLVAECVPLVWVGIGKGLRVCDCMTALCTVQSEEVFKAHNAAEIKKLSFERGQAERDAVQLAKQGTLTRPPFLADGCSGRVNHVAAVCILRQGCCGRQGSAGQHRPGRQQRHGILEGHRSVPCCVECNCIKDACVPPASLGMPSQCRSTEPAGLVRRWVASSQAQLVRGVQGRCRLQRL